MKIYYSQKVVEKEDCLNIFLCFSFFSDIYLVLNTLLQDALKSIALLERGTKRE